MERMERPRDVRPDRLAPPPGVLVVSPSFLLRSSYASALEQDGCQVLDASSLVEARWHLAAAATGEGCAVAAVVLDTAVPGAGAFGDELRTRDRPPGLVLVGRGGTVENARRIDAVLSAVDAALASGEPEHAMRPARVVVAIADDDRRDEVVGALVRKGAAVVEVDDGLALLELLGRQLARGPRPDAVVADACLPRLDGAAALDEIRRLDAGLQAIMLTAGDAAAAAQEAVREVCEHRRR